MASHVRRGSDSSVSSLSTSPRAPESKYKKETEASCCWKLSQCFARLCGNASKPKEPADSASPRGSIVASLPHFNAPLNKQTVPYYGSVARHTEISTTRTSEPAHLAPPPSEADPYSAAERSITETSSPELLQVPPSQPQAAHSGRAVEHSAISSTSRNLKCPDNSAAGVSQADEMSTCEDERSTFENVDLDENRPAPQSLKLGEPPNAPLSPDPKTIAVEALPLDSRLPQLPIHLASQIKHPRRSSRESQIP